MIKKLNKKSHRFLSLMTAVILSTIIVLTITGCFVRSSIFGSGRLYDSGSWDPRFYLFQGTSLDMTDFDNPVTN